MKKKSFVPRTDGPLRLWLNNLSSKLPTYAKKYGITEQEAADLVTGSKAVDSVIEYNNQLAQYAKKMTAFKKQLINGLPNGGEPQSIPEPLNIIDLPNMPSPGVLLRATSIAYRIKKHISYTESDGSDLGLEGAAFISERMEAKPAVTIRLIKGGHPEIVWKKGDMDALEIMKFNPAINNWQLLAIDTVPHYTDMSPLPAAGQPESWQYRCIYRFQDEQVGEWSDVVTVAVMGM